MSRNHRLYLAHYQQRRIIKLFTRERPDVKAVAFPALPDQRDVLANRVNQESPVILVTQVSPVYRHQKFAYRQRPNHANRARPVHRDPQARLAKMASLDQRAETVLPEKTAPPDHPVPQDPPELRANRAGTDHAATPAETLKATIRCPANAVPTANREKPDLPVPQARPVKTEHLVSPDPAVLQARRVNPAKTEKRATRDHPASRANPEKGAFARNIAPWTVASFSKMARGDKLFYASFDKKSKKNHAFPTNNIDEFFLPTIGVNFYNNFQTTIITIVIIIGYAVFFNNIQTINSEKCTTSQSVSKSVSLF